jgi:hypothetical protein
MKKFKSFVAEDRQVNSHMEHIESMVLLGGVAGTRGAINALRSMRDTLSGQKRGKVSTKIDGAPAVFAGIDPTDGKFFVAKKGIFNKNPKVYKTAQEVDDDTSGDLASKLKQALEYLPELGIKGIVQGDFLYSKADLKKKKIAGVHYTVFHPNTIAYAVPEGTPLSDDIKRSKIGVAWHTTYTGNSFESLKASYGVAVDKFRPTKNVWSQDVMITDMSGATMTAKQTKVVNASLSRAGKIFNKIQGSTLRELEQNKQLAMLIEQFNNTYVRANKPIGDTSKHTKMLIKWIEARFKKEIDKRKTDKGKAKQQGKMNEMLDFFSPKNIPSLIQIFELQKEIVTAKLLILKQLNTLSTMSTFVKTKNGYKVTGEEGFVSIDVLGGGAVKLVDRLEFSTQNFDPKYIKGWDSASRG